MCVCVCVIRIPPGFFGNYAILIIELSEITLVLNFPTMQCEILAGRLKCETGFAYHNNHYNP